VDSTPGPLSSGVLSRLRVVELGHYVAAPLVGQLLADQGADVVKVESPDGDPYRRQPGRFVAWNRGKRSVALDLKADVDRRQLLDLVRCADVVVQNFRPGVLERLGVDFAKLRAADPMLITCSITGFGSTGPARHVAGWEPIVHARAGLHVGFGEADERVWRPFPLASVAAGLLATFGTMAALIERERSGLGQHVETSLFEAALYINGSSILQGDVPPMHTQSRTAAPRVHIYPTADGWLQVVAGTARSEQAFGEILRSEGMPPIDVSGNGEPGQRELASAVRAARSVIAGRTSAEWDQLLADAGVPAGACRAVDDWLAHPLALASKLAVRYEESAFGDVTVVGPPVRLGADARGGRVVAPAPPALANSTPVWAIEQRFSAHDPVSAPLAQPGDALADLTVLDLTRILPGPLAGRHLAELGATVIKIEPPGGEEGYSIPFMYLEGNRSKSSAAIDLKDPAGRERFRELVRCADVVIENARAGVWDRLGLGEADLHRLNPNLIYARSKGYGIDGPFAELRAFEHVIQAMTGIQMTQGGTGPPRMMTVPACDYAAPLYLAIGILCSLLSGRRNGNSPGADASLAVAASVYEAEHLSRVEGLPPVRDGVGPQLQGPDGGRHLYPVEDGWLVVYAATDRDREALRRALGLSSLSATVVGEALSGLTVTDALRLLDEAEVPAAASVQPAQVIGDAQVIDRELLLTLRHPTYGKTVQMGIPFSLSRSRPRVRGPAPELPEQAARRVPLR
jgi:crotonobetainyl-CoA:carnitine CoA-transferase CaiB-like acyl-CoA transferase